MKQWCPGLWIVVILCTLLPGCDTRRDILDDQGVWVRLEIDWRPSGVLPEGVSAYVFSRETGEQVALLLTNETHNGITVDSIRLHYGRYQLLVFNETVHSHDYISFRGTDNYDRFEAYAKPAAAPSGSRFGRQSETSGIQSTSSTVVEPDRLAAAHLDDWEVDYEMIRQQARPVISLVPNLLTAVAEVTVHVQNLHYLHTGGHIGSIDHLAEGIFLATETTNATPATHWFTLNHRTFDPGSETEGTLRASFETFGPMNTPITRVSPGRADAPNEISNRLLMWFLLRDGDDYPVVERDITGKFIREITNMQLFLKVEMGLGTIDDPLIEIPYTPNPNDGFLDADVNEWGDNRVVDVPLD